MKNVYIVFEKDDICGDYVVDVCANKESAIVAIEKQTTRKRYYEKHKIHNYSEEKFNKTTKDVSSVVRGRWYDEDCFDAHGSPIYRCSVCNKTVADNYIGEHKYCLHCGAEMLEEA